MKVLKYDTPELRFSIELADNTTAVYGDGNVGKTCIYNKLMNAANAKQLEYDVLFINMQTQYNVALLQKHVDALFIIDDFDAIRLVRPEIITYLNNSINQVLLFGRDLEDLRIDKHYLYYTVSCENNITFVPVCAERLR